LLLIIGSLLLATWAESVWALPKYADWARTASTGAPIAGAQITVTNEQSGTAATIYQDAAGTMPIGNPFSADASGYFEFFAQAGRYTVAVSGMQSSYDIADVVLVDPTGPQTICSSPTQAALTTVQVGADGTYCIDGPDDPWARYSTTALRFERRATDGTLDDASWLLDGYRAEQGINVHYNTFGHYTFAPEVSGFPIATVLGSDTADAGNFGFGQFNIDWFGAGILEPSAGIGDSAGLWLGPAAGTTTNVDMGIDGTSPSPNDVVVLSTTAPGKVSLTSASGSRAPFVVTAVQNGRALVAVAGVANVNVRGVVKVGDPLVTSSVLGYAKAGAVGSSAPTTLGSALTALSKGSTGTGTVLARIGLVRSR
jgi:hypothetical protein